MKRIATTERGMLCKVPEITLLFWVIKVLTTGMGETTSDYLAHHVNPVLAVAVTGVGLVAALGLQFAARRYVAWIYWLAVVMVSVFGTMAADVLHVGLGVPYVVSTLFFALALGLIFFAWHGTEKTLSIHSIDTPRREGFYWATVLATFALGTAAGDMTAVTMHLGYLSSGVLFSALIAIPVVGYWKLRFNPIFAFWCAYVLTRPLGASFADWIGVPASRGGVGLGTGIVSLALGVAIAALVAFLAVTQQRISADQALPQAE